MSSASEGHRVDCNAKFACGGSRPDEISSVEWNQNLRLQLLRGTG